MRSGRAVSRKSVGRDRAIDDGRTSSITPSSPQASKKERQSLARRLQVVLAARRVRQHAVDVDDDRRSPHHRSVVPGPVLRDVAACARYGHRGLLVVGRLRREVPRLDAVDDRGVGERRRVAERFVLGDVAQQAAHDLARAGLRQLRGEQDVFGFAIGPMCSATWLRSSRRVRRAARRRRAGSRTRRSPGLWFVGRPTTAASATGGVDTSADSTSVVEMLCPDTCMMSSTRPSSQK